MMGIVEPFYKMSQQKSLRGQIRPAILQNPGMDTFRPTEPLSPTLDIKIGQNVLLWEN